jgi:mannosyltransferase OCH1-like enzyme
MWLDKQSDIAPLPDKYHKYVNTWVEQCPDFQIKFWNFQMIKQLLRKYPQYQKCFDRLVQHIEKCDFARFLVMYEYGGLYSDVDFYCLKNPSPLLQNRQLLLIQEQDLYPIPRICNGILGSAPRNQFWLDFLDHICMNYRADQDVLNTTGPDCFGRFVTNRRATLPTNAIIDHCYFLAPANPVLKLFSTCDEEQKYAYTTQIDGTYWPLDDIGKNWKFILNDFHKPIIGVVCLIALIVWFVWFRK